MVMSHCSKQRMVFLISAAVKLSRALSCAAMMRQETPESGVCSELDAFCRTWIISGRNLRSKMITQSVTLLLFFIYSMNSNV